MWGLIEELLRQFHGHCVVCLGISQRARHALTSAGESSARDKSVTFDELKSFISVSRRGLHWQRGGGWWWGFGMWGLKDIM